MAEIIDYNKRKAHTMKEEQQQPNKAQDILQMIRDKQQINPNTIQGFDYLKSIQEDIKLSCDEIIQLVSGRRFCEDDVSH